MQDVAPGPQSPLDRFFFLPTLPLLGYRGGMCCWFNGRNRRCKASIPLLSPRDAADNQPLSFSLGSFAEWCFPFLFHLEHEHFSLLATYWTISLGHSGCRIGKEWLTVPAPFLLCRYVSDSVAYVRTKLIRVWPFKGPLPSLWSHANGTAIITPWLLWFCH